MEVEMMNVSEITPYRFNPRNNDEAVEYVKRSIEQFGFKVPIVIDKNNIVVAGHTRLKAVKELNIKEVPVIKADDLTEEQVKAFRLADNKVAEKAQWDEDLLMQELEEIEIFDMSELGFDELEEELEAEDQEEKEVQINDKDVIVIEFETESELEDAFVRLNGEGY